MIAMILQVPFEQFAATVERLLKHHEAYVTARGTATLATAASPDRTSMVVALGTMAVAAAKAELEKQGLKVFDGGWHTEGLLDLETEYGTPYVAAVAYASDEAMPGLWLDAYKSLPTQTTVLRALYDEFRETGQVADIPFEEFIRLAQPTVVIASPDELHSFVDVRKPES